MGRGGCVVVVGELRGIFLMRGGGGVRVLKQKKKKKTKTKEQKWLRKGPPLGPRAAESQIQSELGGLGVRDLFGFSQEWCSINSHLAPRRCTTPVLRCVGWRRGTVSAGGVAQGGGRRGGAVPFSSGPPQRGQGELEGGGSEFFEGGLGAFLNSPFHSEPFECTQVRGASRPLLPVFHTPQTGGKSCAPVTKAKGDQVGCPSLITVVCGLGDP